MLVNWEDSVGLNTLHLASKTRWISVTSTVLRCCGYSKLTNNIVKQSEQLLWNLLMNIIYEQPHLNIVQGLRNELESSRVWLLHQMYRVCYCRSPSRKAIHSWLPAGLEPNTVVGQEILGPLWGPTWPHSTKLWLNAHIPRPLAYSTTSWNIQCFPLLRRPWPENPIVGVT